MYITSLGFGEAKSNTSLFVFQRGIDTIYLLLYVDDIILTTSSTTPLQHTIFALKWQFTMKGLGPLHHILTVSVEHQADGFFLTQRQFTLDILECARMVDYKPVSTLVNTHANVSVESEPTVVDPT
jgi:hypothetical protein